jgi:hypothetical protein
MKCYIGNSVCLRSCIQNVNKGIPGGLFIGVVRGFHNNVRTPPTHPVHTECTTMGSLQSFHTFSSFTRSLSRGNTCPFQPGFHLLCRAELRPIKASASSLRCPLRDVLHLHELLGPLLGSNPRHPTRNCEMRRFTCELVHAEVDCTWRHQGGLRFTAFCQCPLMSSEA